MGKAAKRLIIAVDPEDLSIAQEKLGERYDVVQLRYCAETPDIVLSCRAHYWNPAWWEEPKLLEVALKRARAKK